MRAARPETVVHRLIGVSFVLGLAFIANNAAAQDSTVAPRSYWLVGTSLGVPTFEEGGFVPDLMTLGLHLTRARPSRIGPDLSIVTMPYALSQGVGIVGIRAGLALAIPVVPGVTLLPSGGLSLVGGASGFGAGGLAGFNVGGATVVQGTKRLGMRAGATWHRFQDAPSGIWLIELGLVRRL